MEKEEHGLKAGQGREPAFLVEVNGRIGYMRGLEHYLVGGSGEVSSIESLQDLFGESIPMGRPCSDLDDRSPFRNEVFEISSLCGHELVSPLEVKLLSILSNGICYRAAFIEEADRSSTTVYLLDRARRALDLISRYNRALIEADTEEDVLQTACDLLVEVGKFEFAWIGLRVFDEEKSVVPVAQAGRAGEGYLEGVRISWGNDQFGQGPTGRAIREGKAVVEKDIPGSLSYSPWKEEAIKRGFFSSAAIPLRLDGEVIGAVNVYSSNRGAFGPEELGLLTQIADGIALGLDRVRTRHAHHEALDSLRRSQVLFETISRAAPDAVIVVDDDCRITFWNEAAESIFGYTEEEATGKIFSDLVIDPQIRSSVTSRLGERPCGGNLETYRFEVTAVNKEGERLPVELSVASVRTNSRKITILFARDITEWKVSEARLRESSKKLEKLHDIARKLESLHDENEVYVVTVKAAESILNFSICTLDLVENDRFVVKATSDGVPEGASVSAPLSVSSIAAKTYFTGKTIVIGDMQKEPGARPTTDYLRSIISAPFGDIGVFQAASPIVDAFTENDVRFLELLLGHAFQAVKRIRLERDLKEQAIRDPLTGMFNRRYFNEVIEHELYRSARYSHPIGFLMIDIDRFKEINDKFGHQVGDKVLQAVARFLKKELRASDIVIRYGGDEFLAMLLETDGETDSVKSRLERRITADAAIQELVSFPITLSIGSAHWEPSTNKPIEEILAEADQRMYEEKRRHQSTWR